MAQTASTFRDNLICEYRKFVVNLALKLLREFSLPQEMLDELKSAGYLGLVEAATRYRPGGTCRFSTFAFFRIRGAMIDYLRKSSFVSGTEYRRIKRLQAVHAALGQSEIADGPGDVALAGVLDKLSQGVIAYRLVDESEAVNIPGASTEDIIAGNSSKRYLHSLVKRLPLKERRVIEGIYFRDLTYSQIARRYRGMTRSWACRLHRDSLKHLKEMILHDRAIL